MLILIDDLLMFSACSHLAKGDYSDDDSEFGDEDEASKTASKHADDDHKGDDGKHDDEHATDA